MNKMTQTEEFEWAKKEYEEEMEQLNIDLNTETYDAFRSIILSLKLQKQINKMQNQIDDMKYDILHHPHSF
jgi:hypothetical protein